MKGCVKEVHVLRVISPTPFSALQSTVRSEGYTLGLDLLLVSGQVLHEWSDKNITLNDFIGILTILS